jgi:hypothetical protein
MSAETPDFSFGVAVNDSLRGRGLFCDVVNIPGLCTHQNISLKEVIEREMFSRLHPQSRNSMEALEWRAEPYLLSADGFNDINGRTASKIERTTSFHLLIP